MCMPQTVCYSTLSSVNDLFLFCAAYEMNDCSVNSLIQTTYTLHFKLCETNSSGTVFINLHKEQQSWQQQYVDIKSMYQHKPAIACHGKQTIEAKKECDESPVSNMYL